MDQKRELKIDVQGLYDRIGRLEREKAQFELLAQQLSEKQAELKTAFEKLSADPIVAEVLAEIGEPKLTPQNIERVAGIIAERTEAKLRAAEGSERKPDPIGALAI